MNKLERIEDPYRKSKWAECASACKDALSLPLEDEDEWYWVRVTLSVATSRLEGTEAFDRFVAPAIRGMVECARRLEDSRRGHCLMTAGHLSSHRTDGNADTHRDEAIGFYREAVKVMEPGVDTNWALTVVSLGIALLETARTLTTAEIADYGDKVELAKDRAREAIGFFESALQFYTSERDDENREDAASWIISGHSILNKLDLRDDTFH